jgi:hypothetical protein
MPNVKAQSSNKILNFKLEMPFYLAFEIPLAFACLREAPPVKALCGGQALRRRQGF